jgi:hypothetical protein
MPRLLVKEWLRFRAALIGIHRCSTPPAKCPAHQWRRALVVTWIPVRTVMGGATACGPAAQGLLVLRIQHSAVSMLYLKQRFIDLYVAPCRFTNGGGHPTAGPILALFSNTTRLVH